MNCKLELRLAGFRMMHDGDQHEVIAIREDRIEAAMGLLELSALNRFAALAAEAEAQALRLTHNREAFILREHATQQVWVEAASLDQVAEALERRKAERPSHKAVEGEHAIGWVDHGARARQEERKAQDDAWARAHYQDGRDLKG